MIYSYNTLGIYNTKDNRQYDNTGNQNVLHYFETNNIPAIQIIVDSVISSCTYKLFDINDTEIASGVFTVETDINGIGEQYSRLIFLGETIISNIDGLYYLEITYDSGVLYTDVFCWVTDVTDLFKISATTTDMNIGGFKLNMVDFTYEVYLLAKNFTEEFEIEEEGIQKTFGNIPLFNSRNHIIEYDVTGYRKTYDFLSGLRTVLVNGTVTVNYLSDISEVYDIEIPDKKSNYGNTDIIIIGVKFKLKDYLQVRNEV